MWGGVGCGVCMCGGRGWGEGRALAQCPPRLESSSSSSGRRVQLRGRPLRQPCMLELYSPSSRALAAGQVRLHKQQPPTPTVVAGALLLRHGGVAPALWAPQLLRLHSPPLGGPPIRRTAGLTPLPHGPPHPQRRAACSGGGRRATGISTPRGSPHQQMKRRPHAASLLARSSGTGIPTGLHPSCNPPGGASGAAGTRP